ncbi:prolyl oligopeptidase family serine peptidase [Pseudonocardia acidicola]|uniref:S9 family peptidase n=1 Tax=Pseudonocardia acidicola TaxID=2724939 RepID=A0ABX1SJY9_9PSEU|nr:prolyl oligopeptidase family serine peptidase [Pseudonocardia acidicola]NMI01891.1 S9 family peptidase [Pseudonocardia acidicola]
MVPVPENTTENPPPEAERPTPFHDLQDYLALPRVGGLALSPDGSRLVTAVSAPDPTRTRYVTALWEVDPAGERPARRLTRSAKGEQGAVFTPDGDLLFVSARPDPDAEPKDDAPAALWLLPAGGGEARVVGTRPGGVAAPVVATGAGTVLATSMTLPGAVTGEDDEQRRTARTDKKISAILHTGYPVRFWDHDLGPDQPRLLAGTVPSQGTVQWADLTPAPGGALLESTADISPDGHTVVAGWRVAEPYGSSRSTLVAIDVAGGGRRTLADDPGFEFSGARISPDGRIVAAIRERRSAPTEAPRMDLVLVPLDAADGEVRVLAPEWDRWPADLRWTPTGDALIVVADENGRSPLFRIGVAEGTVTRLTGDDGAYTDPRVSPDGRHVYALRGAVGAPPAPVRLDAHAAGQQPVLLPGPAQPPALPGTLTEVTATAEDGSPLRAWLALPDGHGPAAGEPAPLLLWIHGGPLGSWNTWQWRWNPWLMVARGYAVLLPDPALSTGYGQRFVDRGWGEWGGAPYTDLLALTDAAEARPDVDATRTAAMGGSFGGYMANWVAGHTDRFSAIVTHAGLWALEQFGPTTDAAYYWLREMTAEMAAANSPHAFADAITTPMLVIHGDKDYRVPIGEALRLWWDLVSRQQDPQDQPHRFLYFPDENHWILTPQHAALWYETVTAFLDHHVLGKDFQTPELLR